MVTPPGHGRVTGGIIPCNAIGESGGLRYDAGTVTVLEGHVTWHSTVSEPSMVDVLPTTVVEKQTVSSRATYGFDLLPGEYVLQAGYSYASVTLNPGDDVWVDIPNRCI